MTIISKYVALKIIYLLDYLRRMILKIKSKTLELDEQIIFMFLIRGYQLIRYEAEWQNVNYKHLFIGEEMEVMQLVQSKIKDYNFKKEILFSVILVWEITSFVKEVI